jgi:hypothetical protein
MRCREDARVKSTDHEVSTERWSLTKRGAQLLAGLPEPTAVTACGSLEREHLLEISLQSLMLRESLAMAAGRFK